MTEYAVYKGDTLKCMGTARECAEQMGIKLKSFKFYLMPAYQRRVKSRKKARNYIEVVEIED